MAFSMKICLLVVVMLAVFGVNGHNPKMSSVCEKDSETTFSESLFEDPFSVTVREAVLNTIFFQKMVNNTLTPEEYGGYMVQDAAFIFDYVTAFKMAATNMQDEQPRDFALFYRGRSESYTNYGSYFYQKWNLKNSESVKMGPAVATYVEFAKNLAQRRAKYLSIGILPCDMLWPWVATQLNETVSQNNVYRSWVDDNLPHGISTTQSFVNKFFTKDDKDNCQPIFNEGIINELNFFRSACGEDPVYYSFGDSTKTNSNL
ncbi:Hypothetical predicted protein [Paramuricea clavata]|uniref:Thiaminase-2/PQQC domain-containing protein n=1 Tax=Paramuricea clavata TaxID=317549 RepID=A0A7D9IXV0_PARCT|nr:Hypothetical predicted protein [Paramuricea clavata]